MSTAPVTETESERKYEVPAGAALPDWSAVRGVAWVRGPEQRELDARYFDTTDLRLLDAGFTAVLTLYGLGGLVGTRNAIDDVAAGVALRAGRVRAALGAGRTDATATPTVAGQAHAEDVSLTA